MNHRQLAAPRISLDQYLTAIEDANTASVNFLKIDLETGLTFSRMALRTSDPAGRHRNTRAARRAYDTITRLLSQVQPRQIDSELLSKNLRLLRSDLLRLGERV